METRPTGRRAAQARRSTGGQPMDGLAMMAPEADSTRRTPMRRRRSWPQADQNRKPIRSPKLTSSRKPPTLRLNSGPPRTAAWQKSRLSSARS